VFRREAHDLLERGHLEALIACCRERLAERPNHTYAHWYLRRAYDLQERWDDALDAFEAVKRVSPNWTGFVDPYIERIRSGGGFS
jgi:cytochrome c-type biogenesis protein CcmH/NrfG